MELPWDSDQHGRDGSDDGWWLYKSIHVLTALEHQRTHVQLLLLCHGHTIELVRTNKTLDVPKPNN
uniref:Uncharacterized protein n=1 Tax=Oryza meridionalis TaxID=40149 RepID=A0A0E0C1K8_9ORYZ